MIFSIEYAHYDGTQPLDTVIEFTNEKINNYLKLHQNAQKTIMFDDIHSKVPLEDFLEKTQKLKTAPDCIYNESAFNPLMKKLFEELENKEFFYVKEDNKEYLRHHDKRYNQINEFPVRLSSGVDQKFSCPALVATSYLYKLGYFDENVSSIIEGEGLMKSTEGKILSILPSQYLQVEANAQRIIALVSEDYLDRLEYIFY